MAREPSDSELARRVQSFRYISARSFAEAATLLGPDAMIVAGGTDLIPNMKHRLFTPQPLGEIIVDFAPSGYEKLPDRASVYPLDGQQMLNGFMRPGVAKQFLPGRYKVDPKRSDTAPQEVVVKPNETTTVVLQHRPEE